MIVDCGVYSGGRRRPEDETDVARAVEAAAAQDGFVWIGLSQPTAAEFATLQRELDLPQLAVEDAVKAHQRPKLERYDDLTFAVVKPARYVDHDEVVRMSELAIFLGPHVILTVRHGKASALKPVREALESDPQLLKHGPGAVLHAIVDRVVDDYSPALEGLA